MKSITVSRRLKFLNKLLQQAAQEDIVLRSADGEQFILTHITPAQTAEVGAYKKLQAFVVGESDDFDEEIAITRQNTALMVFLDERATHVNPGKNSSLEEIRHRLGD